jgi:hypothetical protein
MTVREAIEVFEDHQKTSVKERMFRASRMKERASLAISRASSIVSPWEE